MKKNREIWKDISENLSEPNNKDGVFDIHPPTNDSPSPMVCGYQMCFLRSPFVGHVSWKTDHCERGKITSSHENLFLCDTFY